MLLDKTEIGRIGKEITRLSDGAIWSGRRAKAIDDGACDLEEILVLV